MARKRVSPTLLTDGISLVKGEEFQSWRTVGSVVAAAQVFSMRDVDELALLDVSATRQNRPISLDLINSVSNVLSVPLVVGGGIRNLVDFEASLRAGADKVVIGSAAGQSLEIVSAAANKFGTQAVVVSIDVKGGLNGTVCIKSGTEEIEIPPTKFAKMCQKAGAGEILLQNVDLDGTMKGMDQILIAEISSQVPIPVIAAGGAASYSDLYQALVSGAEAVSAGAMFQFTEQTPKGARDFLMSRGIDVRVAS